MAKARLKFTYRQASPTVWRAYCGEQEVGRIVCQDDEDWSGTANFPTLTWVSNKNSMDQVKQALEDHITSFVKRIVAQ